MAGYFVQRIERDLNFAALPFELTEKIGERIRPFSMLIIIRMLDQR